MSANNQYVFLVMDGRANYDIDEASVIEAMGELNPRQAYRRFLKDYSEYDYVLVCFENPDLGKRKVHYIYSEEDLDDLT